MNSESYFISEEETLDRSGIETLQRQKLAKLFDRLPANAFYRRKLSAIPFNPLHDSLSLLPFTTRKELEQDQAESPPYGSNLTDPFEKYCRFHQTSGSMGRSMRILDTTESWSWIKRTWALIFAATGVNQHDRLIYPFSFGPFIGFWGAFEGATSLGFLAIPAGGLSTHARLRLIQENHATVVCCTPTYALRLAEVAAEEGLDIANSSVRAFIVAGEPGGSIPSVRHKIESAWNARVFDHIGMTEVGPSGVECLQNPGGVHILESEFIAEVIDPQTLQAVPDGEMGELVLTSLGRISTPLVRYRTGDRVVASRGKCKCGRSWLRLEGGLQGRYDEMFTVRGNNVFPTAIESLIRQNPEVAEFRVEAFDDGALTQVSIDLELSPNLSGSTDIAQRIAQQIQNYLSFRANVRTVPPGTLPRFEMKARRFVRRSTREPQANVAS